MAQATTSEPKTPPSDDAPTQPSGSDEVYWAVGIGVSGISFPDYVGSDERRNWPLPFPYVVYESRRVTVDQGTLSGALLLAERLRLDLSAGGALPVESDDNEAREGMDDLDAVLEAGPSLKYEFYRSDDGHHRFTADLPLRAAISVGLQAPGYVGLISNPNVEYRLEQPAEDGRWTFRATTGPIFTDAEYNDYFYGVPRRDVRSDRPSYRADGGYAGWRIGGGFSRRWQDFWFGGFVRYINLNGAAFEDSPLVKTENYLIGGFGVAWIFVESDDD